MDESLVLGDAELKSKSLQKSHKSVAMRADYSPNFNHHDLFN